MPPGLRLLGARPEPWRPTDSAAFAILMAFDLGEPARSELRRAQWLAAVGPERLRELLALESLHVPAELESLLATLDDPTADEEPAELGEDAAMLHKITPIQSQKLNKRFPLVLNTISGHAPMPGSLFHRIFHNFSPLFYGALLPEFLASTVENIFRSRPAQTQRKDVERG